MMSFPTNSIKELEAEIERLATENKALRAAVATPPPDDMRELCACGDPDCFVSWRVEYSGAVLTVVADGIEVLVELPENIRLFQRLEPSEKVQS